MPDEPEGKWSLQLLHGGTCFGASSATVNVQALLAPIDELVFEGTFTFPKSGRKLECKVWKRWCASTLEKRSASMLTGCWRTDTYSLCYVFTEHQLKPRLRDDVYLGEPAIDAEAYHHVLSPIFGEACIQNASLGDYSLDFCQHAILACGCTLKGSRFLQNIVYEAAEEDAPQDRVELILEAMRGNVMDFALDRYAYLLLDTVQYGMPWKRVSFIGWAILREVEQNGAQRLLRNHSGCQILVGLIENNYDTEAVQGHAIFLGGYNFVASRCSRFAR